MKWLVLFFALVLSACATLVPIRPEGQRVLLSSALTQDIVNNFEPLGGVQCSAMSDSHRDLNMLSCKNDLRNQAGAQGGDIAVILSQEQGDRYCDACVRMSGRAYRRKNP